jgi:hypothetical protein
VKRFLYRFGFEGPVEWEENQRHGWDGESSDAFWVIADNEEEALAWGREVSEVMVREFFERSGWEEKVIPSWKEAGYAHWIEDPPGPEFTNDLLASLLVVEQGKMPHDLGWLTRSEPEG